MNPTFQYVLNQAVSIKLTGEKGTVIGRAEYSSGIVPQYQVEYVDANGAYQERWLHEDKIQAVEI